MSASSNLLSRLRVAISPQLDGPMGTIYFSICPYIKHDLWVNRKNRHSESGLLALVLWCAQPVCCVYNVHGNLALLHRCARPLFCVCGILRHSALVHRCARSVCCVCGGCGPLALVHRCLCERSALPACLLACPPQHDRCTAPPREHVDFTNVSNWSTGIICSRK